MQHRIQSSTAGYPLSRQQSRSLLRVSSGAWAGRLAIVYQDGPDDVFLTWSDPPHTQWSAPQQVAADASEFPIEAVITPDGDICVAYSEAVTRHLAFCRLTLGSAGWTSGATVHIYNGGLAVAPSLAVASDGTLWASFSVIDGLSFSILVKSSPDGGAVWGSGPGDPGALLKSELSSVGLQLLSASNQLHLLYAGNGNDLFYRRRPAATGVWSDEQVLLSGGIADNGFAGAVAAGGLLGIAGGNESLSYREYDGSNWGGAIEISPTPVANPQLTFLGNVPVVVWQETVSSVADRVIYSHRSSGQFSTPAALDSQADYFDSVLAYHSLSGSFEDLTSAAANGSTGDLVHSQSAALLTAPGDSLYIGLDAPFRFATCELNTPGVGGSVSWQFWNGSGWSAFTPFGGAWHFSTATRQLELWQDLDHTPADWQQLLLDGVTRYWVRAVVIGAFSTPPVGSRITAMTTVHQLKLEG